MRPNIALTPASVVKACWASSITSTTVLPAARCNSSNAWVSVAPSGSCGWLKSQDNVRKKLSLSMPMDLASLRMPFS
ncbi:hypothetical protein D3C78_1354420 [compost metagenome]